MPSNITMWKKDRIEQALHALDVMFYKDEAMKNHTSFQVGGPASFFCVPQNMEQLLAILGTVREEDIPHCLIGCGSNVIFKDEGYNGVVIHLGEGDFAQIQQKENHLQAGAATRLSTLCIKAQSEGLTGLEFAYGIPGSVGGAVYMNAGAYGGEICDTLASVQVIDESLSVREVPVSALEMGYRCSCFQKNNWVMVGANFVLKRGDPQDISLKMQTHMQSRKDKQPLDYPSAGSAFKRPTGAFAAALIEQCGLKGRRVGGAAISEKHSGFIVNIKNASCQDILVLADEVAHIVKEKTGYHLEREFQVLED